MDPYVKLGLAGVGVVALLSVANRFLSKKTTTPTGPQYRYSTLDSDQNRESDSSLWSTESGVRRFHPDNIEPEENVDPTGKRTYGGKSNRKKTKKNKSKKIKR